MIAAVDRQVAVLTCNACVIAENMLSSKLFCDPQDRCRNRGGSADRSGESACGPKDHPPCRKRECGPQTSRPWAVEAAFADAMGSGVVSAFTCRAALNRARPCRLWGKGRGAGKGGACAAFFAIGPAPGENPGPRGAGKKASGPYSRACKGQSSTVKGRLWAISARARRRARSRWGEKTSLSSAARRSSTVK